MSGLKKQATPRVVQICVSGTEEEEVLFALDEEGGMWRLLIDGSLGREWERRTKTKPRND